MLFLVWINIQRQIHQDTAAVNKASSYQLSWLRFQLSWSTAVPAIIWIRFKCLHCTCRPSLCRMSLSMTNIVRRKSARRLTRRSLQELKPKYHSRAFYAFPLFKYIIQCSHSLFIYVIASSAYSATMMATEVCIMTKFKRTDVSTGKYRLVATKNIYKFRDQSLYTM